MTARNTEQLRQLQEEMQASSECFQGYVLKGLQEPETMTPTLHNIRNKIRQILDALRQHSYLEDYLTEKNIENYMQGINIFLHQEAMEIIASVFLRRQQLSIQEIIETVSKRATERQKKLNSNTSMVLYSVILAIYFLSEGSEEILSRIIPSDNQNSQLQDTPQDVSLLALLISGDYSKLTENLFERWDAMENKQKQELLARIRSKINAERVKASNVLTDVLNSYIRGQKGKIYLENLKHKYIEQTMLWALLSGDQGGLPVSIVRSVLTLKQRLTPYGIKVPSPDEFRTMPMDQKIDTYFALRESIAQLGGLIGLLGGSVLALASASLTPLIAGPLVYAVAETALALDRYSFRDQRLAITINKFNRYNIISRLGDKISKGMALGMFVLWSPQLALIPAGINLTIQTLFGADNPIKRIIQKVSKWFQGGKDLTLGSLLKMGLNVG